MTNQAIQSKDLAIKKAVEYVMAETGKDEIEAISAMQTTCVKNKNESLLMELIEYKSARAQELGLI